MLAWQHSWFSSYLQGGDGRLGLLLLSLDIISSLKLQAEIIVPWWGAPRRSQGIAFASSTVGTSPPCFRPLHCEEDSEGCWDRLAQPASCWKPVLLLQHAHRTRCHMLPGPGSDLGHGQSWAACTLLACVLEQSKGSMAPVTSFQPALCPPSVRHPSCASCTVGVEWETHASCLAIFVPQTPEQSSDIHSFSFAVPKSFS